MTFFNREKREQRKRGQSFNIEIITGGTEEAGMPRQVRVEFEGARYPVMARGDRREAIVRDDGDRRTFVRTLGEASGSLAESRTELFKDGTGGIAESAQGDERKGLLAEIVQVETTVRMDWISGQLQMGTRSGCCRAIGLARERLKKDRKARKYRQDILKNPTLND